MTGKFTIQETVNTLSAIFEKHRNERLCVIGTICVGKTTLIKYLSQYQCEDLDAVLWPSLPAAEIAFLDKKPWTEEMGAEIDRLIHKYVKITPGRPLFTSVIVDCEAVVYLDISDELLSQHCEKRGASFQDAKKIKRAIEGDWNDHIAMQDKVFYYIVLTE